MDDQAGDGVETSFYDGGGVGVFRGHNTDYWVFRGHNTNYYMDDPAGTGVETSFYDGGGVEGNCGMV